MFKVFKEAFQYKESKATVFMLFLGIAVCYLGSALIPNQTFSFIVMMLGCLISMSGANQFSRVVQMIMDENEKKGK